MYFFALLLQKFNFCSVLKTMRVSKVASCQIYSRTQNCTRTQNRTKILLHEGRKLHEDNFARRVTFVLADSFVRRHFYTGWVFYLIQFFKLIINFLFLFFHYFTITVTPNPYHRSVFNLSFSVCYLVFYILFFRFIFTLVQNWPLVQNCLREVLCTRQILSSCNFYLFPSKVL